MYLIEKKLHYVANNRLFRVKFLVNTDELFILPAVWKAVSCRFAVNAPPAPEQYSLQ